MVYFEEMRMDNMDLNPSPEPIVNPPEANIDPEPVEQTIDTEIIPEFRHYNNEINDLKGSFDKKEDNIMGLINKRFENQGLTYSRFTSVIDNCHKLFYHHADAALSIIGLAPEYSDRLDESVKEKISILESIIEEMNNLIEELIIHDGEDGLVAWYMTRPMVQVPGQFQYNTNVLSRIGFDVTVRDIVTYNRQTFPVWYTRFEMKDFGMKRWNDSPREYVAYGLNADTILGDNHKFHYCVLDSLFGIRETLKLDDTDIPEGFNFHNESHNQILPLDDGTYLITTAYLKWLGDGEQGVQVSKRDKSTHQTLATAYFPEDYLYDEEKVIGLERSPDGGVYLAYMVSTYNNGSGIGQVAVVKMDKNLNVEWQRHCLESTKEPYSAIMRVMSNGDLAIGGSAAEEGMNTGIFFIVFNDEGLCITETEAIIRPYTYYPNPVQNELRLQYSPDVQPKEIELFDLQGRLVRTQNKNLESLSLQGLPSGTYTMCVTLEDGKVYSDKVVKE